MADGSANGGDGQGVRHHDPVRQQWTGYLASVRNDSSNLKYLHQRSTIVLPSWAFAKKEDEPVVRLLREYFKLDVDRNKALLEKEMSEIRGRIKKEGYKKIRSHFLARFNEDIKARDKEAKHYDKFSDLTELIASKDLRIAHVISLYTTMNKQIELQDMINYTEEVRQFFGIQYSNSDISTGKTDLFKVVMKKQCVETVKKSFRRAVAPTTSQMVSTSASNQSRRTSLVISTRITESPSSHHKTRGARGHHSCIKSEGGHSSSV